MDAGLRIVHDKVSYELSDGWDEECGCRVIDMLFGEELSNVFVIPDTFSEGAVKGFVAYLKNGISSLEDCYQEMRVADKILLIKLLYLVGADEVANLVKAKKGEWVFDDLIDGILEAKLDDFSFFISDKELVNCINSTQITVDLAAKIATLPWSCLYPNFPSIMAHLSPEVRREFLLNCVRKHGEVTWLSPVARFGYLSESNINAIKESMSKTSVFAKTAIEDILKARSDKNRIKREMGKAVFALVDKNDFGDGNFYAGRALLENFGSQAEYEKKGLNLIRKASSKKFTEAQAYLLDHYIKRGDVSRVLSCCQDLMNDNKRDFVDRVMMRVMNNPEQKRLLNAEIWKGLLRIGYITGTENDLRMAFIRFYMESLHGHINDVADLIPRNCMLSQYDFLFKAVSNSNCTTTSTIFLQGYNYLLGVSCRKNVVKAIQLFSSISHRDERAAEVLSKISDIRFSMAICGDSGTGKTELIEYISNDGVLTYQRGGIKYTILLEECESMDNIPDVKSAAICYNSSEGRDLSYVKRWYNGIHSKGVSQICVIHTNSCKQFVDAAADSEVMLWSIQNNMSYVPAYTCDESLIGARAVILDFLVDVALNTVSVKELPAGGFVIHSEA